MMSIVYSRFDRSTTTQMWKSRSHAVTVRQGSLQCEARRKSTMKNPVRQALMLTLVNKKPVFDETGFLISCSGESWVIKPSTSSIGTKILGSRVSAMPQNLLRGL